MQISGEAEFVPIESRPLRSLPALVDENTTEIPPNSPSFERALVQLEAIVEQLEDGETGLAAALDCYEQGVRLLKQCYTLLDRAERRIELLCGVDAQGNPVAQPFDDEASLSLDEKRQTRSRRKKAAAKGEVPGGGPVAEEPGTRQIDEPGSLF
jgi:exodeoxyribonuclease VII small subunit